MLNSNRYIFLYAFNDNRVTASESTLPSRFKIITLEKKKKKISDNTGN